MNAKYKVLIMESDSWSGQKVIDWRYFDSKKEADTFVTNYNAKNNEDQTPAYYTKALTPDLIDLDEK